MSAYLSEEKCNKIKNILKNDGVIAFPTDTVWGIGCLLENQKAVEKIYSLKSREKSKPMILLGNDTESLLPYVENFHENAKKIMEKYFPGAVTLVLQKSLKVPDYITSGFETVWIRVPVVPVFVEMLEKCTEARVLATTSANISEMGANITKAEVVSSIGDKIDYILDDSDFAPKGTESTVVFVDKAGEIKIFRQGAVEIEL